MKFTARVEEKFVEFDFELYENETLEDKDVLEALDERAWDEIFRGKVNVQVFGPDGHQVAIPGSESSEAPAEPEPVRGPGNDPIVPGGEFA